MKPAILRPAAEQDLLAVTRWYSERGGQALGERAFDAARDALMVVERRPGSGSPKMGEQCGISGLRAWPVKRFPLRWFYFEQESFLDVVRLLGDRQDIAAILTEPEVRP